VPNAEWRNPGTQVHIEKAKKNWVIFRISFFVYAIPCSISFNWAELNFLMCMIVADLTKIVNINQPDWR